MPQTLNYAPRDPDAPWPAMPRRYGPWLIYFLCWMGCGLVAGALAGLSAREIFHGRLLVFRGDDFLFGGMKLGAIAGGVGAWRVRHARRLHIALVSAGCIGSVAVVCTLALTWAVSGSNPFFWRPTLTVLGIIEVIFLALATMGGARRFLNKWLAKHPPLAAVQVHTARVMALVPDQPSAWPRPLDYAPRDANAPSTATMLRAVLRHVLWLIYFLCWMAAGLVGGIALAAAAAGNDDNWIGVGSGLGALMACAIAWLGRHLQWLHILCIMVGVIGAVAGAWQTAEVFRGPHPYLWEVGVAVWGVVTAAFLALTISGCLGLFLRKSLVRRPPLAPVNHDLVRTMTSAPNQCAKRPQAR